MTHALRLILSAPLVAVTSVAAAQIVQQPVVDNFSIGTSVSIPDRGEVLLGGVGRASESSSTRGFPWRRGAYARRASTSSMTTGVYVHDFEAMDAAVLNAATSHGERPSFTKGRYDDATSNSMSRRWSLLASERRQTIESSSRNHAGVARGRLEGLTPLVRPATLQSAERFLSLAEAAEKRGDRELAAVHYRYAARHGSEAAARRLTALEAGPANETAAARQD